MVQHLLVRALQVSAQRILSVYRIDMRIIPVRFRVKDINKVNDAFYISIYICFIAVIFNCIYVTSKTSCYFGCEIIL